MNNEFIFQITRHNKTFTVHVVKKNVKRTSLRMNQFGEIIVTTNHHFKKEDVVRLLSLNTKILDNMINQMPKTCKENEIMLFGNVYEGVNIPSFQVDYKIVDKTIYYKNIDKLYEDALKEIEKQFNDFVRIYPHKEKVQLFFRKMRSRWGVCYMQKNKIVLTTALVHVPKNIIQYVIVHEFCHFAQGNHSPAFYQEVSKYYPNYKEAQKEIKQYSYFLP